MSRVPNWAGAIALSCLILILGAWGASIASSARENNRGLAVLREESMEVRTRLTALEKQISEMREELRSLIRESVAAVPPKGGVRE
jgi:hypothetical protein